MAKRRKKPEDSNEPEKQPEEQKPTPPGDKPAEEAPKPVVQPDISDPLTQTPPPSTSPTEYALEKPAFADREQGRRMHGEPKNGVIRREAQPNPQAEASIALSDSNDGPMAKLYRERRSPHHGIYEDSMAIQFSEKPSDEVRVKLRDNGWQWRQGDGVWKKPLGDNPATEHLKAQRLFEEIGNTIRAENGLQPVTQLA